VIEPGKSRSRFSPVICSCGGRDRRLSILTALGVHSLVGFAGVPAVIPDVEIEPVRQTIARSVLVEPYPFLKCGDWVRVKAGPLEGIEGILVRYKKLFRLVLYVHLLEKSVCVEVDAWMVEPAPRTKPRFATDFFPLRAAELRAAPARAGCSMQERLPRSFLVPIRTGHLRMTAGRFFSPSVKPGARTARAKTGEPK